MISRTSGILVGISLFAFVMFSSCGGMFNKDGVDSVALKEALQKALAAEGDIITVDSGGYKITIPKHMKATTELNDDALLQYKSKDVYKELYVIILDEPKDEFIETFSNAELKEVFEYNDKFGPEMNYRLFQMKVLRERMALQAEPAINKTKINGLDAEIVDITGYVEEVDSDIYYKIAFVEGTDKLYMIMTWTLDSKKNENSEEMDGMINSFKLAK